SFHKTLSRNKTVDQRYKEDTTSLIGYKNNNFASSHVSLSDNESDIDIYGDDISSPLPGNGISLSVYRNDSSSTVRGNDISSSVHENNISSPAYVSSPAHRNISSSVHENDISLPVYENNISLPNYRNGNIITLNLATNIRNGMMTRIDEVSNATSTSTLSREPVLKLLEIDQLDEFVSNEVWNLLLQMHLRATDQAKLNKNAETLKALGVFVCQIIKAILIAQDNHKNTQNII
ncbi:1447_t:CDS:2, partial [Racocetra fulgida]